MDWADAAILSTAIFAVVNILDSHLVAKRMPSLRAFLIPAGILGIITGAILLSLFPLPHDIGVIPLLITMFSSILRALAVLLILHILQTGEVSRVIPVVHAHPVFVAILAALFLGETLDYLEWIAILITVAGAMLISIERDSSGSRIGVGRSLAKPLIAGFLLATANPDQQVCPGTRFVLEYARLWPSCHGTCLPGHRPAPPSSPPALHPQATGAVAGSRGLDRGAGTRRTVLPLLVHTERAGIAGLGHLRGSTGVRICLCPHSEPYLHRVVGAAPGEGNHSPEICCHWHDCRWDNDYSSIVNCRNHYNSPSPSGRELEGGGKLQEFPPHPSPSSGQVLTSPFKGEESYVGLRSRGRP